jgi:hypothetical protein
MLVSWQTATFETPSGIDFAGSGECDRSNTAMQIVTAGEDCAGCMAQGCRWSRRSGTMPVAWFPKVESSPQRAKKEPGVIRVPVVGLSVEIAYSAAAAASTTSRPGTLISVILTTVYF